MSPSSSIESSSIELALARFAASASIARSEREQALLDEAAALLEARPYFAAGLIDDARHASEETLELEAAASLRLVILHQFVTPLERDEATTAAALRLSEALEEREDELARCVSPELALRHAALRLLHPRPNGAVGDDAPRDLTEALASLLRRLEARRDPRGFFQLLQAKLHQHAQFYRLFFRARAYLARARRIRERLPPRVEAMPAAVETFRAVEQMGPIVDNFVFDGRGGPVGDDAVGLADYGFLYMQMADELVDSILHHAGPGPTLAVISRLALGDEARGAFVPLMYLEDDDFAEVGLSASSMNEKYGTTLGEMVLALRDLRGLLEAELDAMDEGAREGARAELSAFFHHCFSTFLDELELLRSRPVARLDGLPLGETLFHFYRKNNLVMMRWLGLRARLRGLDPAAPAARIRAFGYVLSTFQIFDDLKDLAVDLGKQPNYALQIASSTYPHELARAEDRFKGRAEGLRVADIPWVNLKMPATTLACFRLVKLIARAHFSWFEDYVVDLRWRRNWLVRRGNFNPGAPRPHLLEETLSDTPRRAPLAVLARSVLAELAPLQREASDVNDDELLAFAFDVLAFERRGALCLAALPNLRRIYRILNLSMRMAPSEKAEIIRKILKRAPRSVPATSELPAQSLSAPSLPRDSAELG